MVCCAVAVLLFAGAAVAESEQWLRYHTGPSPRGYRWLELSQSPPPNVPLPKLQPGAYYGRWDNGMDVDGGRWFCVDRSRRGGAYDRLFFDTTGDGRLDNKSPVNTLSRDERMSWFDSVRVLFQGEDGPITYHLRARFYQFDQESARMLVGAGGWYEGDVVLAGKKRRVQLFDNTVNGVFNDTGTSPAECDLITVDGQQGITRYVGRYLEIDGQLLDLEIVRDGAYLKVQPAKAVAYGTVRVPETISEFTALGPNGHFVRRPKDGALSLPVGHYRVHAWQIEREDENRGRWTLSGRGVGRAGEFSVAEAEPVTVAVGEPVQAVMQAVESRNQIAFDLEFVGSLGEPVQILRGGERPRAPRLEIASGSGDFRVTHSFEYG